jgi:type III restriction enzyme
LLRSSAKERTEPAVSSPEQRGNAEWHYVLLGEQVFYDWRERGASIRELLDFAKLRPVDERVQATFSF